MTDTQPTRQALEAVNRSAPNKVTGRLRGALMSMIWEGLRRDDAARANGMSSHGLREALRKSHVKAFYLAELGVLRESERPKTFHRLCDLRDQDENKNAAVAAAKALEQISDEQSNKQTNQASPGVTIRIVNQVVSPAPSSVIDVSPFDATSPDLSGDRQPEPSLPASSDPIFKLP